MPIRDQDGCQVSRANAGRDPTRQGKRGLTPGEDPTPAARTGTVCSPPLPLPSRRLPPRCSSASPERSVRSRTHILSMHRNECCVVSFHWALGCCSRYRLALAARPCVPSLRTKWPPLPRGSCQGEAPQLLPAVGAFSRPPPSGTLARIPCVHVTNERAVVPDHFGLNVVEQRQQFPSTADIVPAGGEALLACGLSASHVLGTDAPVQAPYTHMQTDVRAARLPDDFR